MRSPSAIAAASSPRARKTSDSEQKTIRAPGGDSSETRIEFFSCEPSLGYPHFPQLVENPPNEG